MIRIANERHNTVSDASARMWALKQEKSTEGHGFRRFVELKLERYDNPVFVLSWTVFHVINEESPLFGDLKADGGAISNLILSIKGYDENMAQEVRARHWYTVTDIRWRHRYADIMETEPDGTTRLNYDRFHDFHPETDTGNVPG